MYISSPHCHFNLKFVHPVSGTIVVCELQHEATKLVMLNAANEYVEHIKDVCLKLLGQLYSRLEYVTSFHKLTGIPYIFRAENFFNVPALDRLFSSHCA